MSNSIDCVHCGKRVDLSFRYCPQCGHAVFMDLSRKDLTGDIFIDVLSSVYNLIITPDIQERHAYYHPGSEALIHKRYELEYKLEVEDSTRGQIGFLTGRRFSAPIEAINARINSRSSNAVTGYAIRVTEELIVKKKTPPFSTNEVENGINVLKTKYIGEHIVKNISGHMSDKSQERRMLFIFYIQDGNKHMNYFLDEQMLQRWFDTILQTNTKMTIAMYQLHVTPNIDTITEEVLNDMVFGYCVRLSESLFPIAK